MAYGDTVLDEIIAQIRGSEPRVQGRITQTSSFGLPPAASAAEGVPFYRRPIKLPSGLGAGLRAAKPFLGPVGYALAGTEAMKLGLEANAERFATPSVQATVERGRAGYGAIAPPVQVPIESAVPTPTDLTIPRTEVNAAEILRRNYAPERGTGAISVNGGPAEAIDTRPRSLAEAQAAVEAGRARLGARPLGLVGSLLALRQKTGEVQTKAALAKAASADLAARGRAASGAAAERTSQLSAALAAEHLRVNPGDYAGAGAILHGRAPAVGSFSESITSLPDPKTGAISLIDRRMGAVQKVIPKGPAVTEANIKASMQARRLTREQAIAAYKAAGHDVGNLR